MLLIQLSAAFNPFDPFRNLRQAAPTPHHARQQARGHQPRHHNADMERALRASAAEARDLRANAAEARALAEANRGLPAGHRMRRPAAPAAAPASPAATDAQRAAVVPGFAPQPTPPYPGFAPRPAPAAPAPGFGAPQRPLAAPGRDAQWPAARDVTPSPAAPARGFAPSPAPAAPAPGFGAPRPSSGYAPATPSAFDVRQPYGGQVPRSPVGPNAAQLPYEGLGFGMREEDQLVARAIAQSLEAPDAPRSVSPEPRPEGREEAALRRELHRTCPAAADFADLLFGLGEDLANPLITEQLTADEAYALELQAIEQAPLLEADARYALELAQRELEAKEGAKARRRTPSGPPQHHLRNFGRGAGPAPRAAFPQRGIAPAFGRAAHHGLHLEHNAQVALGLPADFQRIHTPGGGNNSCLLFSIFLQDADASRRILGTAIHSGSHINRRNVLQYMNARLHKRVNIDPLLKHIVADFGPSASVTELESISLLEYLNMAKEGRGRMRSGQEFLQRQLGSSGFIDYDIATALSILLDRPFVVMTGGEGGHLYIQNPEVLALSLSQAPKFIFHTRGGGHFERLVPVASHR